MWCYSVTIQACAERRTELLQRGTTSKEPRCRSLITWLTYHPCIELESSVEQLAMFGAGSRCPCLGAAVVPSTSKLRFLLSQDFRSPVLSYSVPPATVDNIYCHNSSLGPWSWEWIWPLSCQQSQVSASQQMMAGRTSCKAWGPSLHNTEVHLPLITLHTALSVLSCPGFHGNGIHCP